MAAEPLVLVQTGVVVSNARSTLLLLFSPGKGIDSFPNQIGEVTVDWDFRLT